MPTSSSAVAVLIEAFGSEEELGAGMSLPHQLQGEVLVRTAPPGFEAQTVARDFTLLGRPSATLTAPSITSIVVGLESRPETTVVQESRDLDVYRRRRGVVPRFARSAPGGTTVSFPKGVARRPACLFLEVQQVDGVIGSRTCEWSKRERGCGGWSLAAAYDTQMVEAGSAPG
jgi:hypothetical protein